MVYRVRVHHAALRIQSTAMAARHLNRVIDFVHDSAVKGAAGGPYSTGRLASSIYRHGPIPIGDTVRGEVGSKLSYAVIVERGARVHSIFPKGAPRTYRFGDRRRPQLKFVWRGRVVYTPHVPMSVSTIGRSHPGSPGKHFLLRALMRASARYRMQLRVVDI